MIHIYTGDGKGKTTAAVGLAVRSAGNNKKIVFAQFIKTMPSGELISLAKLGIVIIRSELQLGFTFLMNEKTKALCRKEQQDILESVVAAVQKEKPDLIILDEALDALNAAVLDEDALRSFIKTLPADSELVLTGRPVPEWLAKIADYYSQIKKIKHPFDNGVKARYGIER
jgi:cob(I)alamin adenosyltransferase